MEENIHNIVHTLNQNPILAYYIAAAAGLLPMLRIYKRAGFKGHGAFLILIPFIGYLFAMAGLVFRRWPVLPAYVLKKKEEKAV